MIVENPAILDFVKNVQLFIASLSLVPVVVLSKDHLLFVAQSYQNAKTNVIKCFSADTHAKMYATMEPVNVGKKSK